MAAINTAIVNGDVDMLGCILDGFGCEYLFRYGYETPLEPGIVATAMARGYVELLQGVRGNT